MGFFNRKKDDVLDLRRRIKTPDKNNLPPSGNSSGEDSSGFAFLGNLAAGVESANPTALSGDEENPQSKLAKRLLDMTNKLEELSNQIYHVTQRIEVLEKKLKVSYD